MAMRATPALSPAPVSSNARCPQRRSSLVRHLPKLIIAGLLALASTHAAADRYSDGPFVNDAEPDAPRSVKPGRKWQENAATLPAWPRDADLVEVPLDIPDGAMTHYIDKRSLSTGSDDVVRYTLVSESASGARNVSFEGLRCTARGRWKTYAYGVDGRLTRAGVNDDWIEIRGQETDPLHYDLWRHYLCIPRAFKPRPQRSQIRGLQSGRAPTANNLDFLTD
jgi:hypothetical protein